MNTVLLVILSLLSISIQTMNFKKAHKPQPRQKDRHLNKSAIYNNYLLYSQFQHITANDMYDIQSFLDHNDFDWLRFQSSMMPIASYYNSYEWNDLHAFLKEIKLNNSLRLHLLSNTCDEFSNYWMTICRLFVCVKRISEQWNNMHPNSKFHIDINPEIDLYVECPETWQRRKYFPTLVKQFKRSHLVLNIESDSNITHWDFVQNLWHKTDLIDDCLSLYEQNLAKYLSAAPFIAFNLYSEPKYHQKFLHLIRNYESFLDDLSFGNFPIYESIKTVYYHKIFANNALDLPEETANEEKILNDASVHVSDEEIETTSNVIEESKDDAEIFAAYSNTEHCSTVLSNNAASNTHDSDDNASVDRQATTFCDFDVDTSSDHLSGSIPIDANRHHRKDRKHCSRSISVESQKSRSRGQHHRDSRKTLSNNKRRRLYDYRRHRSRSTSSNSQKSRSNTKRHRRYKYSHHRSRSIST